MIAGKVPQKFLFQKIVYHSMVEVHVFSFLTEITLSWCDKLASTPAVGYQYEQHFASGDRLFDSLSPMTNSWYENGKPTFTIAKHESFQIELQHNNGFTYQASESKASVTFQHRLKLRNTSAGLPVAEFISQPLQFTKILDDAFEEVVKMSLLLPEMKSRHINRVGVVATTVAVREDLPPGLLKMIDYFARPWRSGMDFFNIVITAGLRSDDNYIDRCMHSIGKAEGEEDNLITFRLDWQRLLRKPVSTVRADMEKLNTGARRAALQYFEDLAVGNAFDEHIISEREAAAT